MIAANELRIGNLVYEYDAKDKAQPSPMIVVGISNELLQIRSIDTHFIWDSKPKLLTPIPITSEWVKRLGFELDPDEDRFEGDVYEKYSLGICDIYFDDKDSDCPRIYFDGNLKTGDLDSVDFESRIKYVHEAQNLFFYITGTELIMRQMN